VKIAFGNDHAAGELKTTLVKFIEDMGHEVIDCGAYTNESVDYPEFGEKAARLVANKEADFGVLICGTGIGISLAANKVKGIRAAVCSEPVSARLAREHNDANMIAVGARIVGDEMAKEIVKTFLTTDFSGVDRHQRRIDKIMAIEE